MSKRLENTKSLSMDATALYHVPCPPWEQLWPCCCLQGSLSSGRRVEEAGMVTHRYVCPTVPWERVWRELCWEPVDAYRCPEWTRPDTETKLSGKGGITQVGRDSCPRMQHLETPRLFMATNRNAILAGAEAWVLVFQTIQILLPISRLILK